MRQLGTVKDPFYAPFGGQILIKGKEEDGKWIVYLQASNESKDREEEVVVCKALKEAAKDFLSYGVLSWDHKHKMTHDPEFIIGEPLDVQFTEANETLVKGFLYQKNEKAKHLWNNIQSGAQRLGASVGGGVLEKSDEAIERLIWDEVAITYKPVNDKTLGNVQLIPFNEFVKALTAGSGVNAAEYTGGRALTGESLQGDEKKDVPYEEMRKMWDSLLGEVNKGRLVSMNDVHDYILDQGYSDGVTAALIKFISRKLPGLK